VTLGRGKGAPLPGAASIFHRMHTRLGCQGRPPHFVVEIYPYANLVNTIRLREDIAHVRLSDLLGRAPLAVLEAAAGILLARLYRRRPPRELQRTYRDFSLARSTERRMLRLRHLRGRRPMMPPQGKFHDLAHLFGRLNRRYFAGRLSRPQLGWSVRKWRTQLGCFDAGLDQIVINSQLDRARVPGFVIEYVLFHEMLHVKHSMRMTSCGFQLHAAEFRREEKQFRGYERARRFLERPLG
jgi:Protein of unknown function DUF45